MTRVSDSEGGNRDTGSADHVTRSALHSLSRDVLQVLNSDAAVPSVQSASRQWI